MHNFHFLERQLFGVITVYSVRQYKRPHKRNIIFRVVQYFFAQFSEIFPDTTFCYYCRFYHVNFPCPELAHFWM